MMPRLENTLTVVVNAGVHAIPRGTLWVTYTRAAVLASRGEEQLTKLFGRLLVDREEAGEKTWSRIYLVPTDIRC
jgi:hypothetical protein